MPSLNVASFLSTSTVDYPGELSAVLWLGGCPFRCGFCQNAEVALGEGCTLVDIDEIIARLKKVRGFIDALTVTGGEPTLQAASLKELLVKAKAMGLLTQINTNGYFPENLETLLPWLDYVAIDIKNALDPQAYGKTINADGNKAVVNLKRSLGLLKDHKRHKTLTVEVRTTIVPGLIEDPDVIEEIAKEAAFADVYVLRKFRPCSVLDARFKDVKTPSDTLMSQLREQAGRHANAVIR